MYPELTNLLPNEQHKAFRREYFMRLTTVIVLTLTAVVIVQGVFLLPSYLYERQMVTTRKIELQRLSATLGTAQEQEVQSRLQALQTESAHLLSLGKAPTASTALSAVLAVPHSGITLSGVTFEQPSVGSAPSASRTMQLSGVASTRENLRSYDSALSALSFVSSADLPISAYAKDSAIPFTITLTGTLAP